MSDLREAAKALLDRLREDPLALCCYVRVKIAADDLRAALAADDVSVARDAERYRWLRNRSAQHCVHAPSITLQDGHGIKVIYQSYGGDERAKPRCVLFDEALDKAVDAALAAHEKEPRDGS